MTWSERSLHEWLLALHAGQAAGDATVGAPGSDAAVLTQSIARPVVCADQVIEGRHFDRNASPFEVGCKAAARALSDLAATAATPRALLSTLRAPDARGTAPDEAWLQELLRGVWTTGLEHGAPLVGGDIAAGDGPLGLSVTALGSFEFDGDPPGRERARPGDVVLLTGPVGGSLLGRHLRIRPRLHTGRWLYSRGARAMIDVSDGLALDLSRIAMRSRLAVHLDLARIPVHPDAERLAASNGRSAIEHALTDGEDHELVALAPEEMARAMLDAQDAEAPELFAIGIAVEGSGLWTRRSSSAAWERFEDPGGYLHGAL